MSYHHIFISYARLDNPTVLKDNRGWLNVFVEQLERRHLAQSRRRLDVFLDTTGLKNGDDWRTRIYQELRRSRLFLAVLSENYLKSDICMLELDEYLRMEHALARGGAGIRPIYFTTAAALEGKAEPDASVAHLVEALQTRNRDAGLDLRDWRESGLQILLELDAQERLAELAANPDAVSRKFFSGIDALDDVIARRLDDVALAELVTRQSDLEGAYTHFVGRSADMAKIHRGLAGNDVQIVTALQGLGGVGKTALARQYGHAYGGYYAAGGRWEVPCEGVTHLAQALDQLALSIAGRAPDDPRFQALRLRESEGKELNPQRLRTHLRKLEHFTCADWDGRLDALIREIGGLHGQAADWKQDCTPRMLVILDNVNTPHLLDADVQQALKGLTWLEIIVTTRDDPKTIGIFTTDAIVAVDALPIPDAVALIRNFRPFRTGEDGQADLDAAWAIATNLDGYTLAVELVGAFLAAYETMNLPDYQKRLMAQGLTTPDKDAGRDKVAAQIRYKGAAQMRYKEAQVGLIVDEMMATGLSDEARATLHLAAHFPPDMIPEPWLRHIAAKRHPALGPPDTAGDIGPWQAVMDDLTGRRLLTRATEARTLRLHRVIAAHLLQVAAPRQRVDDLEDVITFVDFIGRALENPISGWRVDPNLAPQHVSLLALSEHLLGGGVDVRLLRQIGVCADVIGTMGSLAAAIALREKTLTAFQQLVADNPGNMDVRRDLSVSRSKMGDYYTRRGQPGDAETALTAYQASLDADKQLVADNPDSGDARRNLSVSLEKMGDVYTRRGQVGDAEAALTAYQASLDIRQQLVVDHPNNIEARRNLSVAHSRMGNYYIQRGRPGDAETALAAYQESLEIDRQSVDDNPDSAEAQRDLSISQSKMGDFYTRRGQPSDARAALAAYQASLETLQQLVIDNPDSAEARRDLSVAQSKLGDIYVQRGQSGDAEAALAAYQASLETDQQLVADNPGSAEATRDLMASLERMAGLAARQGDAVRARSYLQRLLDLLDGFAAAGRPMDVQMRDAHERYRRVLASETPDVPEEHIDAAMASEIFLIQVRQVATEDMGIDYDTLPPDGQRAMCKAVLQAILKSRTSQQEQGVQVNLAALGLDQVTFERVRQAAQKVATDLTTFKTELKARLLAAGANAEAVDDLLAKIGGDDGTDE